MDFGEETFTPLPPAPGALPTIGAVISLESEKIFVPRGSDIKANDKFVYQSREYRVLGWPIGDQDHPLTGDDFGWMYFKIGAAS
ncbi:hypothetical protein A5722_05135 [Mycobacterium vulneris]|nr:hypothetical protein A5721_26180 [Mycolicibacterium vulneris]OCB59139.1 hypothetical protein A5722_05135 [Mycolicibacterium vulneris]OCB61501.1 hypothetical protein A5729_03810 [Mycolicibacterium vulneris]